MNAKALKLFKEAWDEIKRGNFFDESINRAFDYMIKSLWKTPYSASIRADIIKHLPSLAQKSKGFEAPPPYLYILISLKDNAINKIIQEIAIFDFVKSNATEESTYHILNLMETFSEKQVPIENFINAVVKNINQKMNHDMVEALAYMISIQHPETMRNFIKKFLSFPNDSLLKSFINMHGRKGMLELTQVANPTQLNKILKLVNK